MLKTKLFLWRWCLDGKPLSRPFLSSTSASSQPCFEKDLCVARALSELLQHFNWKLWSCLWVCFCSSLSAQLPTGSAIAWLCTCRHYNSGSGLQRTRSFSSESRCKCLTWRRILKSAGVFLWFRLLFILQDREPDNVILDSLRPTTNFHWFLLVPS